IRGAYHTNCHNYQPITTNTMKPSQMCGLCALVALGLAYNAKANTITFLGTDTTLHDQNPLTVLAHANAFGVDADEGSNGDLLAAARLSAAGTVTNSFGTFTVTTQTTAGGMVEFLTFTMNAGFVLGGAGIHGGSGTDENFFSINDGTRGVVEGPFFATANKHGIFHDLSNFDIFVEGATSTPDGGTTAILLGGALTGLGVVRRYVKR